MGNLFAGGSNNSQQSSTVAPAAFQQTPVNQLLGGAQVLATGQTQSPYPFSAGNLYASMNDTQKTASNNMVTAGNNNYNYAPLTMGAGYGALGGLQGAGTTAQRFSDGYFNNGSNEAGNATQYNTANAVGMTNQGLQGALSGIQNNNMGNVVQGAGQSINSGVLQGQIDAVGTDVRRNLGEQQLPQLNMQAAGSGNMDSSRAGVAQGILERGANENLTNAAANMRGQAYGQGLQLAEGINNSNVQNSNSTASTANWAAGEGLQGQQANNTNNIQDLGIQGQGANLQNTQAQIGQGLLAAGGQMGAAGAQQQYQGGALNQANVQGYDNANVQAYEKSLQQPWTALNNASNIIQARNWGSQTNTTGAQTQTAAPMSNLLALGGLAGGLFAGGNPTTGAGGGLLNGAFSGTGALSNSSLSGYASGIGGAASDAYNYIKNLF